MDSKKYFWWNLIILACLFAFEMWYTCFRGIKQLLLVFFLLNCNILGRFYKLIVFFDKKKCHLLTLVRVNCTFSIWIFLSKNNFLISIIFCVSFEIRRVVPSNVWYPILITEIMCMCIVEWVFVILYYMTLVSFKFRGWENLKKKNNFQFVLLIWFNLYRLCSFFDIQG